MEQGAIHIPSVWVPLVFNLIMYLIGGVAAVIVVGWAVRDKIAKMEQKFDDKISSLISAASQVQGEKIQRVYSRLDDYKNFAEATFVRKDMCGALHSATANAVAEFKTEIKGDIKSLIKEFNALRDYIMKGGKE